MSLLIGTWASGRPHASPHLGFEISCGGHSRQYVVVAVFVVLVVVAVVVVVVVVIVLIVVVVVVVSGVVVQPSALILSTFGPTNRSRS